MAKSPEDPIIVATNKKAKEAWEEFSRLVEKRAKEEWEKISRLFEKRVSEHPSAVKAAADLIEAMEREGKSTQLIPTIESLVLHNANSIEQSRRASQPRKKVKGPDDLDHLAIAAWNDLKKRNQSATWTDVWQRLCDFIEADDTGRFKQDTELETVTFFLEDGRNLRTIKKSSFKTIFSRLKRGGR
jgi:hypothetical protein